MSKKTHSCRNTLQRLKSLQARHAKELLTVKLQSQKQNITDSSTVMKHNMSMTVQDDKASKKNIVTLIKFMNITTNKPLDILDHELDNISLTLNSIDYAAIDSIELKDIIVNALTETILPAQKISFDSSTFSIAPLTKQEQLKIHVAEKVIQLTNTLYNIYRNNEQRIEGESNIIDIASLTTKPTDFGSELALYQVEFSKLIKNIPSWSELATFKNVSNDIFAHLNKFILLFKQINSNLFSVKKRISMFKTCELRDFFSSPPSSKNLSLTRENIRNGSETLKMYELFYQEFTSYLLQPEPGQSDDTAKVLECLLEFMTNFKDNIISNIDEKKVFFSALDNLHIIDPDGDGKLSSIISILITSAHGNEKLSEIFRTYINKYLEEPIFVGNNKNILLSCSKLIDDVEDIIGKYSKDLSDYYKNATGYALIFKQVDPFAMLETLNNFQNINLDKLKENVSKGGLPPSIIESIKSEKMLLDDNDPLKTALEINKKFHPLIKACRFGDIKAVSKMIAEGINIHYNSEQAFSDAVINGHYDIADLLLENGADIHVCGPFIIHCLCDNNSINGVEYLFAHGIDVSSVGRDYLFTALDNKNFVIANAILNQGVDVNAKNGILLQAACEKSNYEAIDFLLNNNADLHIANEVILLMACKKADLQIIQYLISKGADIHHNEDELLTVCCANDNDNTDLLSYLIKEKQIDATPYKNSLLHAAELAHNFKVLNYLQNLFDGHKKELH